MLTPRYETELEGNIDSENSDAQPSAVSHSTAAES
jgi:hypothetical protein